MSNQTSCHFNKCPLRQQSQTTAVAHFRCSQCKQVTYCSKACQQSHWKKHRKPCQAWNELNKHVQSLPLEEAHRRFQQTQQTMRELEAYQSSIVEKTVISIQAKPDSNGDTAQGTSPVQQQSTAIERKETRERSTERIRPKRPLAITIDPAWNATIEEMLHLFSYQITLKPLSIAMAESSSPSSDSSSFTNDIPDVSITFEPSQGDGKKSSILRVGKIMSWDLPVQVQEYNYSKLTDCISIRLKLCTAAAANGNDDLDNFLVSVAPVTPRIQQMHCKSCHGPLLSHPVERVVPLPSGYWDEISDYLICYPGQPTVHFGSTTNTVPIDLIWEDPSVWVVHPHLVADTVQPLAAVDLYATQPFHGSSTTTIQHVRTTTSSSWRPQQLQLQQQRHLQPENDDDDFIFAIEQLCCSYCCFALGLATHEGYYLYQHRLVGLAQEPRQQQQSTTRTNSSQAMTSRVSIFMAQELKRHAESQAIFTFVVTSTAKRTNHETSLDQSTTTRSSTSPTSPHSSTGSRPTCLLLHVVSWDSIILHASAASAEIVPKRVVKVIYEVCSNMPVTTGDKDQDISSWTWGGLDICCDPLPTATTEKPLMNETATTNARDITSQKKLKSVHLILDPDELEELILSVTHCPYSFPQEVVDATIRLKLGMSADSSNDAGMAAMDLF
jgi:HECT-like Ubiquitin-conjugating enzyme (E2)-binding/MYND finger